MTDVVQSAADSTVAVFLCGVFGSAAVELLTIVHNYQTPRPFPSRYHHRGYWVARSLIAGVGGVFAVLYAPPTLLLAAHIGASTPLLISTLARSTPDGSSVHDGCPLERRMPPDGWLDSPR